MAVEVGDGRVRRAANKIRVIGRTALVAVLACTLAGCVPGSRVANPSAEPRSTASPSAGATVPPPAPAPAALDPHGSASQNLDYFASALKTLAAKEPHASGRSIVDRLTRAGFAKKDMEVTPDKTAVGLDADSVQVSVRVNGTCLVGQVGNVGVRATAEPLLASGHCLLGKTRAIDW